MQHPLVVELTAPHPLSQVDLVEQELGEASICLCLSLLLLVRCVLLVLIVTTDVILQNISEAPLKSDAFTCTAECSLKTFCDVMYALSHILLI